MALTPFATTNDLEARWRSLTPSETTQAATLLGDASTMLRSASPDVDSRLAAVPPTLDAGIPLMIVCSMVKRAMLAAGTDGVGSTYQTVGPFANQVTYSNPLGNLYLTKAELKMLGVSGARAFTIDTMPDDLTGTYLADATDSVDWT